MFSAKFKESGSVPHSCMRSGNCCTNFAVCVTPFDIVRIKVSTGLEPSDFVMTISEPPNRERLEPSILIDGYYCLIVLKWQVEWVCKFYTGTACGIYTERPSLCRTYPFALSDKGKFVEVSSRACPSRWFPLDQSDYLGDLVMYKSEVEAYHQIAQEWNQKGGGNLNDFLNFALKSLEESRNNRSNDL